MNEIKPVAVELHVSPKCPGCGMVLYREGTNTGAAYTCVGDEDCEFRKVKFAAPTMPLYVIEDNRDPK